MKAYVIDRYQSQQGVRLTELPEPGVAAGEVLVRIHAAGVNQLDTKIAQGEFKLFLPYRLPLVLGNDLAGVVVQVGARVHAFQPGDEVYARPDKDRIGTFAEFLTVSQDDLARKPANLTMEEAASLPLVALTAWQALVERANLRPGQKVLIQAGSGGVGTIAIQLAKHLGATVATTASAKNADFLKELGADIVIDYRTQDFATVLEGYDVVLDSQGPASVAKSMTILKPGGMVIGIAGPPDPGFAREIGGNTVLKIATRLLSRRTRRTAARLGVGYSFLFMRASGTQLSEITTLVENGTIRPVIDRVYPFASTPQALDQIAKGTARGKIVISMTESPARHSE
ncbi:NADP-dependent oxidoreductase [Actinoplanes awajinensis]|uniref:NADPH:quinone oxidoreductase n=1 Tax=Actinoplanes awajinensis subsp. mycoplanecinus TaxID=135947 RepID=A0A101JMN6_9ACTN|nr:NADP-dependent oxidoreductase [Actinoplanes awajinensis]KUL29693.1 NADPH:quinone oxidoreductase [Actinoplanes awajinensis subsp. mycoplanecinus]